MSHSPAVLAEIWVQRYEEVSAFCAEHGRLPKQRECAAGKWLAKQREKARAGSLGSEQLRQLSKLPGFAVDQRAHNTSERVVAVVASSQRRGRLPRMSDRDSRARANAQWVKDVRAGKVHVSQEQLEALESVGYCASPTTAQRDVFLDRYRTYVRETGYRHVPARYVAPDGYPLGRRYHRRRAAHRRGELSPSYQQQLVAAGVPWAGA